MKDINWCPLEPKTTGLAPCKHTKAELSDDQGKNGHRKPKPDVLAVIKNMVEKDARDKEFTAQHEAFRKLRTEQNKKANKKKIEQERRNKALRNPARFMNR
ncbi:hypothetical protein MMC14_006919 [Varicellaria rhodocarpa]|nr:hypothetical protein [Varicellaria rhodocarpa]